MATSSSNRKSERMHKYESVRIEWTRYFEANYPSKLETVKDYFYHFHRSHQHFQFSVTKIFDGTTHILVDASGYATIRKEVEKKTGHSGLTEVSFLVPPLSVLYRKAFRSHQAYRDCLNKLRMENEAVYAK